MTEDQLFDELYDSLSTREKWKMVNRLYKRDEILATKAFNQMENLQREFDILEGACDFWKQEAIDRGYKE